MKLQMNNKKKRNLNIYTKEDQNGQCWGKGQGTIIQQDIYLQNKKREKKVNYNII